MSEDTQPPSEPSGLKLPEVDSFNQCNDNFSNISDMFKTTLDWMKAHQEHTLNEMKEHRQMTLMEMREHRDHTHQSLTKMAKEANEHIDRLTDGLNNLSASLGTVSTSQGMMWAVFVVAIAAIIVALKGAVDLIAG